MTNCHYVYEHWRLDREECFYVGKGQGNRANVMRGRNMHHTAIVMKLSNLGLPVEVRIIATDMSQEDAFSLEKERIAYWRSFGCDLANHTAGGDGVYDPSPEVRKKMSDAKKGRPLSPQALEAARRANTGRKATPEQIENLRKRNLGRKQTPDEIERRVSQFRGRKQSPEHAAKSRTNFLGRKHTQETKDLLSAKKKGIPKSDLAKLRMSAAWTEERRAAQAERGSRMWDGEKGAAHLESVRSSLFARRKPVICVSDGLVYDNATQAACAYGIDRKGLTKVCTGRLKSTAGLVFAYLEKVK
jgi:hypothetical protein